MLRGRQTSRIGEASCLCRSATRGQRTRLRIHFRQDFTVWPRYALFRNVRGVTYLHRTDHPSRRPHCPPPCRLSWTSSTYTPFAARAVRTVACAPSESPLTSAPHSQLGETIVSGTTSISLISSSRTHGHLHLVHHLFLPLPLSPIAHITGASGVNQPPLSFPTLPSSKHQTRP